MVHNDRLFRVAVRQRRFRLALEGAAVVLGIIAASELIAASGTKFATILGGLGLVIVPSLAIATTLLFPKWSRISGWTAALASGAAVIVGTSCPPIGHIKGAQGLGLAAVAVAMLTIPVLRGGYASTTLKETQTLGPLGIRVAPKSAGDAPDSSD